MTFSAPVPGANSCSVAIDASTSNKITLDKGHPNDGFKPLVLRAIRYADTKAQTQEAFAGNTLYNLPSIVPGKNIPFIQTGASAFSLIGGTFNLIGNPPTTVMNVSTLTVTMQQPTPMPSQVTGEVKPSANQQDNNVSVWSASLDVLPQWHYMVTACDPITQKPCPSSP